ncbi:hypothetical protein [Ruminococcus albus]|uniref:Uncharacterized protein n=1 Tax=Ruminococcus albus TaxID=1264 RepID=A0A1I1GJI8_RUMAL|nr:hypothetical protein [Ruminococcus albus]SFC11949.1 hypothetical protein SAMN02910406_01205 [Ruminococcus albus]
MNSYNNPGATYSKEEIIPESSEVKDYSSFSELYKDKVSQLSKKEGRTIKTKEVASILGIDYEQLRKYINAHERKTKKRDCIIALCALTGCDATETNEALRLYGFSELDQYHRRDEIIWDKLAESPDNPVSVDEINNALSAESYMPLDIHDHRKNNKIDYQDIHFKLVRRHFQCNFEGIVRTSEPDIFLDLLYDVECYYNMRICFEYLGQGRRFEICIQYEEPQIQASENIWQTGIRRRICPKRKKYIVYAYPTEEKESELHEYNHIDETEIFRECFIKIEKTECAEKQRLCDTVNDTRNYGSRISAKVIGGELHIFCETYNTDIPELSEYYLMDHCGGEYTLYVLDRSCFMQMYLNDEKYEQIYGKQPSFRLLHLPKTMEEQFGFHTRKLNDPVLDQYSSEEDIEYSVYEARDIGTFETYSDNTITGLRLKAYRQMRSEIDILIDKLRTGKAHICNRELLGKDADSMIASYFGVPHLEKNETVYSAEQFRDAFEIGLRTVDEIGAFLQANKSLKINVILSSPEA